jgi:hypothetical protein
MGDVINLRAVRKAKTRAKAAVQADANRAKFGRTKAEKQADAIERARRKALLDGAKLDENEKA